MKRLLIATFLALSACTWISETEHDERLDADGDGLQGDVDCDDEDAAVGGPTTWYEDADGDSFGDADGATTEACEQPGGYASEELATDCDDDDDGAYPGAEELCDEADNDCDGLIDDDAVDADTWYEDADDDGYGNAAGATVDACAQPEGYTSEELATDAEDDDASSYPGADELCDEVDNDQDGEVDEDAIDATTWYLDADEDGYGDDEQTLTECAQPTGYAELSGDCDDGDADYNPGAKEDDCSDPNDYNCDGSVGYADEDEDGWAACEECDDDDAAVNPDADEYCDGIDNDCDDEVDEDDALDADTWYLDADGDDFGDPDTSIQACDDPGIYLLDDSDCDDTDAAINPDADEVCDDADNDCDGLVDDDDDDVTDASSWYTDADGDGYGDPASEPVDSCVGPSGTADDDTDCDDTDEEINPAADEICNDLDDDCDELVDADDDSLVAIGSWYTDADGDGYGDPASTPVEDCDAPTGTVSDNTDCDDDDPDVNPGADELPGEDCFDTLDNDCDGTSDDAAASCAACPESCSSDACLWVDGVLEAEQTTGMPPFMNVADNVSLDLGSFDEVLLGVAGAVVVHEDFAVDAGCFTTGTAASGVLDATAGAATCSVTAFNASAEGWVLALTVVADSPDAAAALAAGSIEGTGLHDWTAAPYLDDGTGTTVPFASGAPDPAVDHRVLLCGSAP